MAWNFFSPWRIIIFVLLIIVAVVIGGFIFLHFGIGGESVKVPDIIGKDLSEALEVLNELDLNLKIMEKKFNNRVPSGIIISQVPPSGESVRINRAVKVVISRGSEMVTVPDVRRMPVRQARMILRKAGLEVGWEASVHHASVSRNYVIAQAIEPESQTKRHMRISLLVSSGAFRSALIMPDFIGRNFKNVQLKIKELGLELGVVTLKEDSRYKQGTIIKQSPPLGSRIAKGNTVGFTVTQVKEAAAKKTVSFMYLRYIKQPGFLKKDALIKISDSQGIRVVFSGQLAPGKLLEKVISVHGEPLLKTDLEEKRPQLKNWKRDFNALQIGPLNSLSQLQSAGG